jgi:hypothetical protein
MIKKKIPGYGWWIEVFIWNKMWKGLGIDHYMGVDQMLEGF